jgi:hypothetical protein
MILDRAMVEWLPSPDLVKLCAFIFSTMILPEKSVWRCYQATAFEPLRTNAPDVKHT